MRHRVGCPPDTPARAPVRPALARDRIESLRARPPAHPEEESAAAGAFGYAIAHPFLPCGAPAPGPTTLEAHRRTLGPFPSSKGPPRLGRWRRARARDRPWNKP